jgi:hypothetical protein
MKGDICMGVLTVRAPPIETILTNMVHCIKKNELDAPRFTIICAAGISGGVEWEFCVKGLSFMAICAVRSGGMEVFYEVR